ncbi:MAG: flagellar FlbD family protein [Caldilineaceae bacterium]|nr:flagellar FlbD family protein [Caldilineaceae bacterium]
MISVTRLDGREFTLNADLIEIIESNPDTFVRLLNGNSFVVRESRTEVVGRIVAFRRRIFQCGMRPAVENQPLSEATK